MTPTAEDSATWTIAFIGNPNTGKSTLFNALSGDQQKVGNYPGVTVEKKLGRIVQGRREWLLVDLPGTYSLAPRSPDEMVAVDVLLGRSKDVPSPDVVICVVAADNIQRNLYLVSQVLEFGRPVVVALTKADLAEAEGLTVQASQLSERLGVPVVPVLARRGQGLEELKAAVAEAVAGPCPVSPRLFPEAFQDEVDGLESTLSGWLGKSGNEKAIPRYLTERLLLDVGSYLETQFALDGHNRDELRNSLNGARARLVEAGCRVPEIETTSRYAWIARVTEGVIESSDQVRVKIADRIDAVLTHKFWGYVILAAILLMMFSAVFSWAQAPMDLIDGAIESVSSAVNRALPEGALRSLIVDGVIGGVGAVVIFLPQIFILFFLLTAMEECGYMARAAYLMDRIMLCVGLSGKSFIPLLSSFACAIPGVMAARIIENRQDRLTTILIAPLMSCSARLPVYTLMIAAFIPARSYLGGLFQLQGVTLFTMYVLGVVVAAGVAFVLKKTLLRSGTPAFVMEMPAYQWPSIRLILSRIWERGMDFLKNAGTVIFAVSLVMWGALYYPRASSEQLAVLHSQRDSLEVELSAAKAAKDDAQAEKIEASIQNVEGRLAGIQQRQSFLGRGGRLIEPLVRPLGWDWRIGSAVIASFPAREVVVATMGVIFDVGKDVEEGEGQDRLARAMKSATWPDSGRPLINIPVALSIMVFFALCAQCVSTLAVIGRETQSWAWPTLAFVYMTVLAYVGAFLTYHIGMWFGA